MLTPSDGDECCNLSPRTRSRIQSELYILVTSPAETINTSAQRVPCLTRVKRLTTNANVDRVRKVLKFDADDKKLERKTEDKETCEVGR